MVFAALPVWPVSSLHPLSMPDQVLELLLLQNGPGVGALGHGKVQHHAHEAKQGAVKSGWLRVAHDKLVVAQDV